jgi:pimeloyl-ACP methyl ester carboxylesterase
LTAAVERIVVRDVELAYELSGPAGRGAVPVVWGHGLTSCQASEDRFGFLDFGALAADRRLLRYDARGHGASGFTTEPSAYSWEELARDQLALTDAVGIDRYVAAGASMGCGTALHAAVLAPERVGALLLVVPPTAWETRREQVEIWEQVATLLEQRGVEPFIEGMRATVTPEPLIGRGDFDEAFEANVRATDPRRLAGVFRGAGRADLPTREQIRAIDVPTRILAWSGDPAHPESTAHQLAELLPHADLFVAQTWDDFRTWTDRAVSFLRSLPA